MVCAAGVHKPWVPPPAPGWDVLVPPTPVSAPGVSELPGQGLTPAMGQTLASSRAGHVSAAACSGHRGVGRKRPGRQGREGRRPRPSPGTWLSVGAGDSSHEAPGHAIASAARSCFPGGRAGDTAWGAPWGPAGLWQTWEALLGTDGAWPVLALGDTVGCLWPGQAGRGVGLLDQGFSRAQAGEGASVPGPRPVPGMGPIRPHWGGTGFTHPHPGLSRLQARSWRPGTRMHGVSRCRGRKGPVHTRVPGLKAKARVTCGEAAGRRRPGGGCGWALRRPGHGPCKRSGAPRVCRLVGTQLCLSGFSPARAHTW